MTIKRCTECDDNEAIIGLDVTLWWNPTKNCFDMPECIELDEQYCINCESTSIEDIEDE